MVVELRSGSSAGTVVPSTTRAPCSEPPAPPHAHPCHPPPPNPQVKLVLQKLAGVNSTPMIALNEAAELLCKHLSVSFCRCAGRVCGRVRACPWCVAWITQGRGMCEGVQTNSTCA